MTQKSTHKAILDRIASSIGNDLLSIISELSNSDLQSVLMTVLSERVAQQSPARLLQEYERNPFCGVSELPQDRLNQFINWFIEEAAERFVPVEFSPAIPLGTNNILTPVSQNNVLSATRGLELIGDPTTTLALEAAKRRRLHRANTGVDTCSVDLCTDHRIIRLQWFDPSMGYMQHFRCAGLITADRQDGYQVKPAAFRKHVQTHLDFITRLQREGIQLTEVTILLSNLELIETLIEARSRDRCEFTQRINDDAFDALADLNVPLPRITDDLVSLSHQVVTDNGISKIIRRLNGLRKMVVEPLQQANPNTRFAYDLGRIAGMGYYLNECFHIYATTSTGLRLQLSDGGFTDWTTAMLSDEREFCFISGFGSELINKMF